MTTEALRYKLVEGLPGLVEVEVNHLLQQGWELAAAPFPRITGDGIHLVVQPMTFQPDTIDEVGVMGEIVKQHAIAKRRS